MATIRPIDRRSIHKICSGQVVVDLATAVKEMVENSLDAGASTVEIKMKEMGSELIEVSDNGSGIDPQNYESIALKHHTSKLQDFSDLESISSFGFRGEALNALCELSGEFIVTTRMAEQQIGATLTFQKDGSLSTQKVAARSVGTTVSIKNLFESLPVRRGEFVRSIKKQYQKLVKVLQSYAIISTGVKIVVVNISKGSKQIVIGTQASSSMADNISAVFGPSFLETLLPINISVPLFSAASLYASNHATDDDADDIAAASLKENGQLHRSNRSDGKNAYDQTPGCTDEGHDETDAIVPRVTVDDDDGSRSKAIQMSCCTVKGFISKAGAGVGRSDNDRQFVFCNGRPVDMPKFSKILNEVWRRYEMKQKPAFILDVRVPSGTFDVNLAPDKREVVVTNEAAICECLRDHVDALYAPSRSTFPLSQGVAGSVQTSLLSHSFAVDKKSSTESMSTNTSEDIASSDTHLAISTPSGRTSDQLMTDDLATNGPQLSSDESSALCESEGQTEVSLQRVVPITAGALLPVVGEEGHRLPVVVTDMRVGPVWATVTERSLMTATKMNDNEPETAHVLPQPVSIGDSRHLDAPRNSVDAGSANRSAEPNSEAVLDNGNDEVIIGMRSSRPQPGRSITIDDDDGDETRAGVLGQPATVTSNADCTLVSSLQPPSTDAEVAGTAPCVQSMSASTQEDGSITANNAILQAPALPALWSFDTGAALAAFQKNSSRNDHSFPSSSFSSSSSSCADRSNTAMDISTDANDSGKDDTGLVVDAEAAERSLARVLKKQDFPRMRVIGQFNLGFIIAELDGDIYILDQHACDEKFRFEGLQKSTTIHQQPLLIPKVVETSAAEEIAIIENLPCFEANGFKLKIDEEAPPGKKVKLCAVPFSKSVQFGEQDIHELASMLSESGYSDNDALVSKLLLKNDAISGNKTSSSVTLAEEIRDDKGQSTRAPDVRLPKLVAMYASRACRSAVMIGTALKPSEMTSIVSKLEQIEQPWNCPHGRPTMRHLVDFLSLRKKRKLDQ